jgi:hypothetical protein
LKTKTETIIDNSVDLSDEWFSQAILLDHIMNYSIQLEFEGSPEGTFSLQSSDDEGDETQVSEALRELNVDHWTTLFGSGQLIEEAGDHSWNVMNAGYKWVRIHWEPTSGSGNLTHARFCVKGF